MTIRTGSGDARSNLTRLGAARSISNAWRSWPMTRSLAVASAATTRPFVFLNRRRNQVKLIVWTRGGFTIVHKRLERGTFTFPSRVAGDATSIAIDVHELAMLLEGIDISRAKAKPRWEPPPRARATTH
ncbi:MAG TPA: IS66 family insertion sequence element accessory protein TnpB [Kofleriaceae bacterium]|nr:IS66 family insertion sequence element accessory protein TnpB [Kofleriaceae bacterium]